jgi:hypothetical protein
MHLLRVQTVLKGKEHISISVVRDTAKGKSNIILDKHFAL